MTKVSLKTQHQRKNKQGFCVIGVQYILQIIDARREKNRYIIHHNSYYVCCNVVCCRLWILFLIIKSIWYFSSFQSRKSKGYWTLSIEQWALINIYEEDVINHKLSLSVFLMGKSTKVKSQTVNCQSIYNLHVHTGPKVFVFDHL